MATCSSVLAWKISWTEEPGGLHSPGGCKELDTTQHTDMPFYPCFEAISGAKTQEVTLN